jgi:hypothetical protein
VDLGYRVCIGSHNQRAHPVMVGGLKTRQCDDDPDSFGGHGGDLGGGR